MLHKVGSHCKVIATGFCSVEIYYVARCIVITQIISLFLLLVFFILLVAL